MAAGARNPDDGILMLTFHQDGLLRRSTSRSRSSMRCSMLTLFLVAVALLSRSACGQWQGYSDLSCDAPLGIDEAMLFLHGFRGTYVYEYR